jgi:catechol 2,3-dioxygenase-like lactoylglutathione lyase family enzyme
MRSDELVVTALDHLVLNVRDVEAAAAWYVRVLGMVREDYRVAGAPRTCVRFGHQMLNLRPVDAGQDSWFTGAAPRAGGDDLCFLTEAEPGVVVRHLGRQGVAVEAGPGPRRGSQGELVSVYCRDPDGNLVEIASYARSGG